MRLEKCVQDRTNQPTSASQEMFSNCKWRGVSAWYDHSMWVSEANGKQSDHCFHIPPSPAFVPLDLMGCSVWRRPGRVEADFSFSLSLSLSLSLQSPRRHRSVLWLLSVHRFHVFHSQKEVVGGSKHCATISCWTGTCESTRTRSHREEDKMSRLVLVRRELLVPLTAGETCCGAVL